MIDALLIILGISILVIIHELGHFYYARRFGMQVEEFGIGFFKRVFSIKINGVIYSLNIIPIGGFVRIKGEEDAESKDKDSFYNRPLLHRSIVILAGVFMNLIVAVALFTVIFMVGLFRPVYEDTIGTIENQGVYVNTYSYGDDSVFKNTDILLEDKIVSVSANNTVTLIDKPEQIDEFFIQNSNSDITILFNRNGQEIKRVIENPFKIDPTLESIPDTQFITAGIIKLPFLDAIEESISISYEGSKELFVVLGDVITSLARDGSVPENSVAGPVGIVEFAVQSDFSTVQYLFIIAIISLNLAIINTLPIPGLDGGRFLFIIIEAIKRSPVDKKTETYAHSIGFMFLILLIILVTFNDIKNIL